MLRELNLIEHSKIERKVGTRTIRHRILASFRGYDFFDGDRNCGYGGFKHAGASDYLAQKIIKEYNPQTVIQLNAEKGFLLAELHDYNVRVTGVEPSAYARSQALIPLVPNVPRETFDLVIAIGVVYTLTLGDAIQCLRRITELGHRSFITLSTYKTPEDYELMRQWTLLGHLLLTREEWVEVLKYASYEGDYQFIDAESLGLSA